MWLYFRLHYQDNVIAGFINSVIIGILAYFIILKKMLICEGKYCFRIGHHVVEGTHYKTCPKHTTAHDHKMLIAKHMKKYPEAHKFLKSKQK